MYVVCFCIGVSGCVKRETKKISKSKKDYLGEKTKREEIREEEVEREEISKINCRQRLAARRRRLVCRMSRE
jgi:hypothetical protein